jgi:predicted AAA+ superfamily ATPase
MTAGPQALEDPERRGRAFELAVGVELLRLTGEIFYWREKNAEVDFVCRYRGGLYGIEVKSGRKKSARGLDTFRKHFPEVRPVIVTPESFPDLSADPGKFLLESL